MIPKQSYLVSSQQGRVEMLKAMERDNNALQGTTEAGSAAWHRHETIDDMIHDLLTMEGE